ncbi:hypothetical protein F2P81_015676 [Scophthalmus maximus]|uniref:Uncharacterized protein n=1 Tax=Scophthalmus maximus TaxID=52904 RepID=A0A6A4SJ19_SCOMX|nr:hypothetical protein F2P81_015676 [Scophthalmus maximus]
MSFTSAAHKQPGHRRSGDYTVEKREVATDGKQRKEQSFGERRDLYSRCSYSQGVGEVQLPAALLQRSSSYILVTNLSVLINGERRCVSVNKPQQLHHEIMHDLSGAHGFDSGKI